MMPPKRNNLQEVSSDSWLISYADMITLLLCFFIVFISISEPKRDKIAKLTEGFTNKFGSVDLSTPFTGVTTTLQNLIEKEKAMKDVVLERTERSIEIELAATRFFNTDSAEFNAANIAFLEQMTEAFKQINYVDYMIIIEAHTNDQKVESSFYPTHWELSAARAARIARFFVDMGVDPSRIKPIGYGSSQPQVPNTDASGNPIPANQALNHRIEIKIEKLY